MKFTVGIPTFNRAPTLQKAIQSVLDQDGIGDIFDLEVIVSDNNSKDDTDKIISNYLHCDGFKYNKNQENLGMAKNWQKCVDLSSGDFFVMLHSDDVMKPGVLKTIFKSLKEFPETDWGFGKVETVNKLTGKCSPNNRIKDHTTGYIFNSELLQEHYMLNHPVPPQSWFFKPQVIQTCGGFIDGTVCTDFNMTFKMSSSKFKVLYINDILAEYVIDGQNIGGGNILRIIPDLEVALLDLFQNAEQWGIKRRKLAKTLILLYEKEAFANFKNGKINEGNFILSNTHNTSKLWSMKLNLTRGLGNILGAKGIQSVANLKRKLQGHI